MEDQWKIWCIFLAKSSYLNVGQVYLVYTKSEAVHLKFNFDTIYLL